MDVGQTTIINADKKATPNSRSSRSKVVHPMAKCITKAAATAKGNNSESTAVLAAMANFVTPRWI